MVWNYGHSTLFPSHKQSPCKSNRQETPPKRLAFPLRPICFHLPSHSLSPCRYSNASFIARNSLILLGKVSFEMNLA